MNIRIAFLVSLWAGFCAPAWASPDDILVGLDETAFFGPNGQEYRAQSGDALLVLDATDPAHPRIAGPKLPMTNSVFGPPVNLQITPDGALGLVASSVTTVQKDGKWVTAPDNRVHVVDMATRQALGDVTVGQGPSGLAIARNGKLALVTNRFGKSISVLRIDGKTVTHLKEVPVDGEVSAIAITPDASRAFFVKHGANRVGVLALEGETASYDGTADIPSGYNPYNIAVTPDGKLAIAVNNGIRGHDGSLTVIAATGPHPRVIDTVSVSDGPEGFAMAPDGASAAIVLLHGSTSAHNEWPYHRNGGIALLAIKDGKVRLLPGEVALGNVPEGVAYSRDGKFVYVADFGDSVLHVLRVGPQGLSHTGTKLTLPGHPASMRGPAH